MVSKLHSQTNSNRHSIQEQTGCQQASDSRQKLRRSLCYNIRVFDKRTNRVAGYISNISLGGVRIMTEYPIAANEFRQFKIELPGKSKKRMTSLEEIIEVDAVSAWSNKKSGGGFYSSGFRFLDMDNGNRLRLTSLMDNYHR